MNDKTQRRPIKARDTTWASAIAAALAKKRIKPNHISLLSIVFAGLSGGCLVWSAHAPRGWPVLFFLAAVLIQCRLLCNLFDGMVAVEGGFKTKSGAIFNDLPDRIADPLILVSAGYAIVSIPSAVFWGWLAGILSVMTAYVRFLGAASGAAESFIGPMAKQHRMATITCALLVAIVLQKWVDPKQVLFVSLLLICAGCIVTIGRRVSKMIRELEAQ